MVIENITNIIMNNIVGILFIGGVIYLVIKYKIIDMMLNYYKRYKRIKYSYSKQKGNDENISRTNAIKREVK